VFKTIKEAWKLPELRKKILFTVMIIVVFRVGSMVPVPFFNVKIFQMYMKSMTENGSALALLNTFSGGAFAQATIFAMSVSPYINSSIIIQLLTVAIPALERLSKEGEEGRKKLSAITRYLTVGLGLIQGTSYYFMLLKQNFGGIPMVYYPTGWEATFSAIVIIMTFTAGTALMMWLGEQINEKGIGNGISILLFAGIVSRMPDIVKGLWNLISSAVSDPENLSINFLYAGLFIIMFLGLVWCIVFMNDAERRVPIQYAKRLVGRKMYGGQSSRLPVKVGLAGVMPVIFASTILSMPATISLFAKPKEGSIFKNILDSLAPNGWLYAALSFLLIIMFSYFYVTIQYNPIEIANDLRQSNGTIPGIRPGKPTADFLSKVFSKVTLIGALFLAFISLLPSAYSQLGGQKVRDLAIGGTSIIILVGVALETVKQMEAQMMQRHYKGFLD